MLTKYKTQVQKISVTFSGFFLICLSACSTKNHIHLIAPHCSEQQITMLSSILMDINNIKLSLSEAELPEDMIDNSILLPKFTEDFQFAEEIAATLTNKNLVTHISYLNTFNHHYEYPHLGVYIVYCDDLPN